MRDKKAKLPQAKQAGRSTSPNAVAPTATLPQLPQSSRPDRDLVRSWREARAEFESLATQRKLVGDNEKRERDLRKQVGQGFGPIGDVTHAEITVDGKQLIFDLKWRNMGLDYETAWKALMPMLSQIERKRAEELLVEVKLPQFVLTTE